MDNEEIGEMEKEALRLAELDRAVIRAMMESNHTVFTSSVADFVETRRSLRTKLMHFSAIGGLQPNAQRVLRKLSEGRKLQAQAVIEKIGSRYPNDESLLELDDSEIECLSHDLFHSRYSHYDYVEGLDQIGSLIASDDIPKEIGSFVDEAKQCYAFQRYIAVVSLCRTLVEAVARDICIKKELFRKRGDNVVAWEQYRWSDLRNLVASGELNNRLRNHYGDMSSLVHGRRTAGQNDAQKIFQKTIAIIHSLYDAHKL